MRESDESGFEDQETPENTARIRELNDALRRTFSGGRVLMTPGVQNLPEAVATKALQTIQNFDAIDDGNDPHQEHDFGAVEITEEVEGAAQTVKHKVWFKLDYYDLNCRYGSPDPANPAVTTRVMTILLPEEY